MLCALLTFELLTPTRLHQTASQRVGSAPRSDLPQVKSIPDAALFNNVFDFEELTEFEARVRRHLGMQESETVDLRLSQNRRVRYRTGLRGWCFIQAGTRGDGETGEDVTPMLELFEIFH